jgi:hypothetical protein
MLMQVVAPLFLLLLIIQAMVGYVELGTDSWITKINDNITGAGSGILLFIYVSGLMFVLRFFGGPIEHRLSPLGLLCLSGLFGALGLTFIANINEMTTSKDMLVILAFLAMTVYCLGKTFLWPTMLAVASERFPKGGAITIGTVGGIGMLSAGLLGGPGIGFKQDYYASHKLKDTDTPAYERYKANEVNSFLGVFHVQGLDGSKTNMLNLETQIDGSQKKLQEATSVDKKQDIEKQITATRKEVDEAFKNNPKLSEWWDVKAKEYRTQDKPPVDDAGLFGSRMALQLTAAIPLTMAVLYLLLMLYFKATGGYKKEVVLTTAAPASEF